MSNILISNLYVEIPAAKPDAGYRYEGPVEDMPRNISPASIVGMPDARIKNVSLRNIEIHYPGGGNANFAKIGLDKLDSIPEVLAKYPEFSMFRELPAWGFYIRHAKNITFENVTMTCEKKDFRTAVVLNDVQGAIFKALTITEPGSKKILFFLINQTGWLLKNNNQILLLLFMKKTVWVLLMSASIIIAEGQNNDTSLTEKKRGQSNYFCNRSCAY